jgi:hypothetical protein
MRKRLDTKLAEFAVEASMHPIGPRAIDESGLLTVAIPPTVVNKTL